jgi:predicted regulator of Ras-like GTPase activity (Roadblock/LC7/MglB family)
VSFTDTLDTMTRRIEGCAAVVLLGLDGIPIERRTFDIDPSLDIELVATEFATLVRRGQSTAADTALGDLNEIVLATDRMSFVIRPITSEYFVVLALNPGANMGRARFELRKAQLEMETEFAI